MTQAQRSAARDIIVGISCTTADGKPGWKYPLARMVTDTDGNVAVFIAPRGKPPVQQFTLADRPKQGPGMVNAVKAELRTATGDTVKYVRRGASCNYALARCNVKTPALMRLWPPETAPADSSPDEGLSSTVEPSPGKPSLADMRAWAKANGFDVKDRGALPARVVTAYKEAHELL